MKNKIDKMVNIMIEFFKNIVIIKQEKNINSEYKTNIGTIYNRSIEESNELLRFKERFKKKYKYAYCYVEESMGR